MTVYTIGFTQKTAERFFGLLRGSGIDLLLDVRISNTSQLAGFAKFPDLPWFLRELCGAEYLHDTALAPTEQLLKDYRAKRVSWAEYETAFDSIMAERGIAEHLREAYGGMTGRRICLLCSEPTAEHCHRRLVAAHFASVFGAEIVHL